MRILLTRVFAVALLLVILCTSSKWEEISPGVVTGLFAAAVFLAGVGALGRAWCSLYIAGRKDRALVTDGPYSLSRNPLYVFSFIGAVGVGLATGTITIAVVLAATFLIYYPFVIRREEKKLALLFPIDFPGYVERVPRFFPHHLQVVESEHYDVNPKIFRRHLESAIWFVWVLGVMMVIRELHQMEILPVWFRLY